MSRLSLLALIPAAACCRTASRECGNQAMVEEAVRAVGGCAHRGAVLSWTQHWKQAGVCRCATWASVSHLLQQLFYRLPSCMQCDMWHEPPSLLQAAARNTLTMLSQYQVMFVVKRLPNFW